MGNLDSLDKHIPADMKAAAASKPPAEAEVALSADLDKETLAEINKVVAKRRRENARLRRRRLEPYVKVLHQFAALGRDKAFAKACSQNEASKMRWKLYLARSQERARVADIEDTEQYVEQSRLVSLFDRICMTVVETPNGWAVQLELESVPTLSLE